MHFLCNCLIINYTFVNYSLSTYYKIVNICQFPTFARRSSRRLRLCRILAKQFANVNKKLPYLTTVNREKSGKPFPTFGIFEDF